MSELLDIFSEQDILVELDIYLKLKQAKINQDFIKFSFVIPELVSEVFALSINYICVEFPENIINQKFKDILKKYSPNLDDIFKLISLQKHYILGLLENFSESVSKVLKAVKIIDGFYIKFEKTLYFILKEMQSAKLEDQKELIEQTNQKFIEQEKIIYENEARLNSLVIASSQTLWHGDANGIVYELNNFNSSINTEIKNLNWLNNIHHQDKDMVIKKWNEAIEKQQPVEIEYRIKSNDKKYNYVIFKAVPVFNKDNKLKEWVGTTTDISDKKNAELELKEEININKILYRIGKVISAELDINKLIEKITEESRLMSGAEYSFFLYKMDLEGKTYSYAVSGIEKNDLKNLVNQNNLNEILAQLFKDRENIRIDDLTKKEIQNDILNNIFTNYDIKSCLILPIISPSGGISGFLFLGSSQLKVFTQKDEKILLGICSQSSIIIDNAILYQESRESEAKFRMLTQSIPEIIWTANSKGEKDYFNDNWYKYTGLTPEQSYGFGWLDAIHPDDREKKISSWLNAVNSGKDYEMVFRLKSFNHSYKWFLVRALPQYNEKVKWVGALTDIDKQKRTQDELDASISELKQFAFIASHDLQEPLRAISSYTQLLAKKYKGKIDKEAEDFINYSVQGVVRLQSLIEDLMVYSNIIQREVVLKAIDLEKVFEIAINEIKSEIINTQAIVTHDKLPIINANNSEMILLFKNLIINSIKYCDKVPEVHIGCKLKHGDWIITFKDNGIGIKKQYFEKIFLMFQRLHNRDDYPGTGMGLAICKKIVERHKGNIWLESNQHEGSIFYISFPKLI